MSHLEEFNFVSFNSRQHALYFSQLLKEVGYDCQMISTPKGVSLGCGLSLSFPPHITPIVLDIYRQSNIPVIGIYKLSKKGNYSQVTRIF